MKILKFFHKVLFIIIIFISFLYYKFLSLWFGFCLWQTWTGSDPLDEENIFFFKSGSHVRNVHNLNRLNIGREINRFIFGPYYSDPTGAGSETVFLPREKIYSLCSYPYGRQFVGRRLPTPCAPARSSGSAHPPDGHFPEGSNLTFRFLPVKDSVTHVQPEMKIFLALVVAHVSINISY